MKRLYGDRLRKDGGLTKTLKSVAGRTLPRAGKHAPEIQRVVREMSGSLEKVEERMTEAVEDFLDHGEHCFHRAFRCMLISQHVPALRAWSMIRRRFFSNLARG